jgi:hypothetical protein
MVRRYHVRSKRTTANELTFEQEMDLQITRHRRLGEKKPIILREDLWPSQDLRVWKDLKEREQAWKAHREEIMAAHDTPGMRPTGWWDYEAPELPGKFTGRYCITNANYRNGGHAYSVDPIYEEEVDVLRRLKLLEPWEVDELRRFESLRGGPEPSYTWEEILAMEGEYEGSRLLLELDGYNPPPGDMLPLPEPGGFPPDWEAIQAELDKGPAQDVEAALRPYLLQLLEQGLVELEDREEDRDGLEEPE